MEGAFPVGTYPLGTPPLDINSPTYLDVTPVLHAKYITLISNQHLNTGEKVKIPFLFPKQWTEGHECHSWIFDYPILLYLPFILDQIPQAQG